MILTPPTSTLFPYTTLFRSCTNVWPNRPGNVAGPLPRARRGDDLELDPIGLAVDLRDRDRALEQARSERRRHFELRSEEHTSELQSRRELVCRLLLEKKKKK